MIGFHKVTYTYPGAESPVLKDVTLSVGMGEMWLVIGPSGAGKSTLLRCINGLVPHFHGGRIEGRIEVHGRDPVEAGPRGMSDAVGFVFQNPETQFVTDVVEDELAFALENHNFPQEVMRRRIEEVLDQLSIAHLRHRKVETLSGGERQRVAIGSALALQPEVLVLDEPTSQLDPQAAEEVLTTLQKLNEDLGLTVVISEHRLERVAQYADVICYMPGQGLSPVIGPPRDVLEESELAPPLVSLGKAMAWHPLPLTIKEGRPFAAELKKRIAPLAPETVPGNGGDAPALAPAVIDARGLWFSYNGDDALRGVDLEVRRGEFVALMGRNGSGKTTLMKNFVGLLAPGRGRVRVLGDEVKQGDTVSLAGRVGFVPQNPGRMLFSETVRGELEFTRRAHDMPSTSADEPLLEQLGLAGKASAYPRDLSTGERQRVALAAILVARPEILLLDEPTRGLDYLNKAQLVSILNVLRGGGVTILMATHDVELVARCADRVVIMGDGQVVVDGPVREVMTESLVFASQVNKLLRDGRFLTVEDVLDSTGGGQ